MSYRPASAPGSHQTTPSTSPRAVESPGDIVGRRWGAAFSQNSSITTWKFNNFYLEGNNYKSSIKNISTTPSPGRNHSLGTMS